MSGDPYKHRETIGSCTLYLADFRAVLPTLSPFHHCITDPPYEVEAHTKGRRLLGKQRNGNRTVEYGALDFDAITSDLRDEFCKQTARVCSGWILAFCQAEAVGEWRDSLVDSGCKYRRSMIWRKPDGPPQFTGDRPGMGYESIVAAWAGTGRSIWNGGGKHGVFEHPQRDNNNPKQHMTQKPIALMLELVSLFTNYSETVIDPFMGSGTTLVACAKLERPAIGIEVEERFFEIACQRVKDAYAQPSLFITQVPTPLQSTFL